MPSSDASFDLLGAFGDDNSTGIGSAPIPDVLPAAPLLAPHQAKINADLFDLFGSVDQSSAASRKPTSGVNLPPCGGSLPSFVTQPLTRKESLPTQPPTAPSDPFADIANLASGLNINFQRSTISGKSPVGSSPQPTQYPSPSHKPSQSTTPQQHQQQGTFVKTPPQPPQSQPGQARPDYSRVHFDSPKPAQQTGLGGNKNSDIFADILGQQGYSFGSKMNQGPRSINELRKEELVKDMDPKKVLIMEWVRKGSWLLLTY